MKKILFVVVAMTAITFAANAQIKYGVKAGLNISQLSDESGSTDMLAGLFVSGHVNYDLGQFFGIQAEAGFSMQGGSEEGVKMRFNYINIPILFEVKPITNLSLFVGPQIGFNVYRGLSTDDIDLITGKDFDNFISTTLDMEFNTIDFGAVVGVQYTIMEHFLISARYNIGFTPTMSSINGDNSGAANRVIQIGIGYQF